MDETVKFIAIFIGSLIPTAVGIGLLLWRLRGIITKSLKAFEGALDRPIAKVQENTTALNEVTSALVVMVRENGELLTELLTTREELRINQLERATLSGRLRTFADTVDEMLLVDKEKTDTTNKRIGQLTEEVRQIKIALDKCLSDLSNKSTQVSEAK